MAQSESMKKGIITSLIASIIFVIILQPLGKLLWEVINNNSSRWYYYYSNYLYTNAALGHRHNIDLELYTGASSMLIVLFVLVIFIFKMAYYERNYIVALNKQKSITNIEKKKAELEKSKSTKIKIDKRLRWILDKFSKPLNFLAIPTAIFIIISIINSNFVASVDYKLNTTFNQRMTIIEPYIDAKDFKILKSQWALMQSKNDYLKINARIEGIANAYKITIPKPLLKVE